MSKFFGLFTIALLFFSVSSFADTMWMRISNPANTSFKSDWTGGLFKVLLNDVTIYSEGKQHEAQEFFDQAYALKKQALANGKGLYLNLSDGNMMLDDGQFIKASLTPERIANEKWIYISSPSSISFRSDWTGGMFKVLVKDVVVYSDGKQYEAQRFFNQGFAAKTQALSNGKGVYLRTSDGMMMPEEGYFLRTISKGR